MATRAIGADGQAANKAPAGFASHNSSMRRTVSDRHDNPAGLAARADLSEDQRSGTPAAVGRRQQPSSRTGSSRGATPPRTPPPGSSPRAAPSTLSKAAGAENSAAHAVSGDSPGGARGAGGSAVPGPTGGDTPVARAMLGVDLRLWLICVYAFLIAINNTSLRPVLPSFVKVRPSGRRPHPGTVPVTSKPLPVPATPMLRDQPVSSFILQRVRLDVSKLSRQLPSVSLRSSQLPVMRLSMEKWLSLQRHWRAVCALPSQNDLLSPDSPTSASLHRSHGRSGAQPDRNFGLILTLTLTVTVTGLATQTHVDRDFTPNQSFGAGATGVGLASSAFSMARLALNVPAGMLGDRIGRKPLLVLGPLLMAAGAIEPSSSLRRSIHSPPKLASEHGPPKAACVRASATWRNSPMLARPEQQQLLNLLAQQHTSSTLSALQP